MKPSEKMGGSVGWALNQKLTVPMVVPRNAIEDPVLVGVLHQMVTINNHPVGPQDSTKGNELNVT